MTALIDRVFAPGLFGYTFMAHAWIAVTAIAVTAGLVGTFVNLRGAAFAAHAIPQASFAGAAAAYMLSASPFLGMSVGSAVFALALAAVQRGRQSGTLTALLLVFGLALGDLLVTLSGAYAPAVYALLFGQLAGVSASQLTLIVVLSAVAVTGVLALYRPLMFFTLSPQAAEARGLPTRFLGTAFMILIVLSAALTVPVVGALLAFSLMVAPAAAARYMSRTPGGAMIASATVSLLVGWIAIIVSYDTGWPIGFLVAALGAVAYAGARVWGTARAGRERRQLRDGPPAAAEPTRQAAV